MQGSPHWLDQFLFGGGWKIVLAHIDSPFRDQRQRYIAGRFGMILFLISLFMIFAAAILAYVVIRMQYRGPWPPSEMPGLSSLLVVSTVVIIFSSITMAFAGAAARRGAATALKSWILPTVVLGVTFLVLQVIVWWEMGSEQLDISAHLYAWSFYVLTGLHGLHVLGGVIPLLFVTYRAFKLSYTKLNHRGVSYIEMYWHFLGVAWLALYATLIWGSLS